MSQKSRRLYQKFQKVSFSENLSKFSSNFHGFSRNSKRFLGVPRPFNSINDFCKACLSFPRGFLGTFGDSRVLRGLLVRVIYPPPLVRLLVAPPRPTRPIHIIPYQRIAACNNRRINMLKKEKERERFSYTSFSTRKPDLKPRTAAPVLRKQSSELQRRIFNVPLFTPESCLYAEHGSFAWPFG